VLLGVFVRFRPNVWAPAFFGVSLLLLASTLVLTPLAGQGLLSLVLFTLGLGGEGNVGAWWSGMLFFVAGVFALDHAADAQRAAAERRGSAALAVVLALLSLDELAWLHEWLAPRNRAYLLLLGAIGVGGVAYSFMQLCRANVPLRKLSVAFALLATVPVQQLVQAAHEPANAWVYGALTCLEEGTELAAALVLLSVMSGGLRRFHVSGSEPFVCFVRFATPLLCLCAVALPVAAAATYALNLTGAANWLGATLFLSCALLALRTAGPGEPIEHAKAALYLVASVGSIAVRPDWDPVLLGHNLNVRGIYFGTLLLGAAAIPAPGKPWRRRFLLALAALTLLAGFVVLRPQVVWSMWPPTLALLCFFVEIPAAVRAHVGSHAKSLQLDGVPPRRNKAPDRCRSVTQALAPDA
jgi:hypothetical protein